MRLCKLSLIVLILILVIQNPLFASNFEALWYLYFIAPLFFCEFLLFLICIVGSNSNLYIKFMFIEFVINVFIFCWMGYLNSYQNFLYWFSSLFVFNLLGLLIAAYKNRKLGSFFTLDYNKFELIAANFDNNQEIYIDKVIDAITISSEGAKIQLIGIKLKNENDHLKAIAYLEKIFVNQIVQLEFDDGPKLNTSGARRAFVYWLKPSLVHCNLNLYNEVLFSKKTLINYYLLNSDYYEPNVHQIQNSAWAKRMAQVKQGRAD